MLTLLELTIIKPTSKSISLGMTLSLDDLIEVKAYIAIDQITYICENVDDNKLTNIYLTDGQHLITFSPLSQVSTVLNEHKSSINTQY